jgi:phage protein U
MAGLLRLGTFTFQPTGPSYQELQESYSYMVTDQDIVNSPNKLYFGGKHHELLQLQGYLYVDLILPQFLDGFGRLIVSSFNAIAALRNSFKELDRMASAGYAYPLVDITGRYYGNYMIEAMQVNSSVIWKDGVPRKQLFTLNLRKDLQSTADEKNQSKLSKYGDTLDIAIVKIRDIIN